MKQGIHKFITVVVATAAVALSGGCAQLAKVQKVAGNAIERQCEKSAEQRALERVAAYFALDQKGSFRVYCPGDPEFDQIKKAFPTVIKIIDSLAAADFDAAFEALLKLSEAKGIEIGLQRDGNGCFIRDDGWKICPPLDA